MKKRNGLVLMAMTAGAMMLAAPAAHADEQVVVFAAASLKNALDEVNKACEKDVGEAAKISYAASSALAKQIEEGAPADVFISADLDWMKYLSDKKLTKSDTEGLQGRGQDREGVRSRQGDWRRQAGDG